MAGLKDDAQWIVLMGFVVSFSLFFLAMLLNQSVVVGQTTAEAVSEFPKDDIRDVRSAIIESYMESMPETVRDDIRVLSMSRGNAMHWRMCRSPVIQATVRSTPSPKPP